MEGGKKAQESLSYSFALAPLGKQPRIFAVTSRTQHCHGAGCDELVVRAKGARIGEREIGDEDDEMS